MSYLGTYQSWSDTWVYTCAECGQEFRVSDPFSPLDGLGGCSAECDRKIEEESHADRHLFVRNANARLIPSRDSATATHPKHNLFCLQDRPA